jgi:hypothetical protein
VVLVWQDGAVPTSLVVRWDPSVPAELDATLHAAGLRPADDPGRWLDSSSELEVRATREDGCLEAQLAVPGSAGLLTLHAVAAPLGAEIYDPSRDWRWRDHGGVPVDLPVNLGPSGRRAKRWIATADVPGPARSLSIAADGTAVVGYDPPRGGGLPIVQVRTGDDLDHVVATHRGLGAPVVLSPDGRLFAAAETGSSSRTSRIPRGVSIVDTTGAAAGTGWSLGRLFGWRSPTELVGLTRHQFYRWEPATGPAATALDALAATATIQLVVADVAGERVTEVCAAPVLAETLYREANLTVAATGHYAVVASCNRLVGVPLAGGPPVWVEPPEGDGFHFVAHWYAAAASACGRFVAFGGNHWRDDPNLLVVEPATGRRVLALDTRSLGTPAAVRALAFHPTGWLAVGFGDGQVRHLTLAGSMLGYRGLPGSLSALAFTPAGDALVLGGASPRGLCRVALSAAEQGGGATGDGF